MINELCGYTDRYTFFNVAWRLEINLCDQLSDFDAI